MSDRIPAKSYGFPTRDTRVNKPENQDCWLNEKTSKRLKSKPEDAFFSEWECFESVSRNNLTGMLADDDVIFTTTVGQLPLHTNFFFNPQQKTENISTLMVANESLLIRSQGRRIIY